MEKGLLTKMYDYLYKLQVTKSQNSFLKLLFNESKKNGCFTSGSNGFKRDVIPNTLALILYDGNNETDELIEYYKKDLFNVVKQKTDGDFLEWFTILRDGINLYRNQSYIDDLNDFFSEHKKEKKNKAAQNNSCAAAFQLSNYFEDIIKTGKSNPCDIETFACSLFSCLYYLEHGYLPAKYSEQINGVYKDRQEFINEVMMKYGCSGNPGKHKIYKLANRDNPNSIALFEAAELEYYGNGFDAEPNFQRAYDYYVKAVEASNYNALAGWSLGYMLYNYGNEQDPFYNAKVVELENMSFESRIIKATEILNKSFECGCYAAANVLGKILTDKGIDSSLKSFLTKAFQLKSGLEYFEIASNAGYTFAKNNLFAYHISKSTSDGDENFNKAYAYLKESADLGEPYAMNKYAYNYLLSYKQNPEEALLYFDEAVSLSEDWAAFNILKCYCSDEKRKKMINNLKRIDNDPVKLKAYIDKLSYICAKSKKPKLREKFKELSKDLIKCI